MQKICQSKGQNRKDFQVPHIKILHVVRSSTFEHPRVSESNSALHDKEKTAWKAFKLYSTIFFESKREENNKELLTNLMKACKSM